MQMSTLAIINLDIFTYRLIMLQYGIVAE